MKGLKFDNKKRDYTLLPWASLDQIIDVLEFGRKKYARDNWKLVDDGKARYTKALIRHLAAVLKGEEIDEESGLSHWAHVGCNVLFILHFINDKKLTPDQTMDLVLEQKIHGK